jgi:hypothetical protein
MRLWMTLPVTALALSSAFVVLPASAQQSTPTPSARQMNDGGYAAAQSETGTAQYNGAGQVVGSGNEAGGSCAQRYHSFDPSTGTYLGFDGARHPCQ